MHRTLLLRVCLNHIHGVEACSSSFEADTVVLTHALPSTSQTSYADLPQINQELLEKPLDKGDNLRMLMDLNGGVCEVVTGLCIGESPFAVFRYPNLNIKFPY
jgi:septum formation protein